MLVAPELIVSNAESVSIATGERFFAHLARNLAEFLNADLASVYEFLPENPWKLRALLMCAMAIKGKTFDYNLDNTPCAKVVSHGISVFPDDVQQLFPLDPELSGMQARSFAGASMDKANRRLPWGLIRIATRSPFNDIQSRSKPILRNFRRGPPRNLNEDKR